MSAWGLEHKTNIVSSYKLTRVWWSLNYSVQPSGNLRFNHTVTLNSTVSRQTPAEVCISPSTSRICHPSCCLRLFAFNPKLLAGLHNTLKLHGSYSAICWRSVDTCTLLTDWEQTDLSGHVQEVLLFLSPTVCQDFFFSQTKTIQTLRMIKYIEQNGYC